MYFSPNITEKPKPSITMIVPRPSYTPTPSVVVARPSQKLYPILNNATKMNAIKMNATNVMNATKPNDTIANKLSTIKNINSYSRSITSSQSPAPTASPIRSFRTNNFKYTYTQIGFFAIIICLLYFPSSFVLL
jgi:hypothetical protein